MLSIIQIRVLVRVSCLLGTIALVASATPADAAPSAPTAAAAASGRGGPLLVELFTSQGCSSCPAAEDFVRDLPRLGWGRERVIPIAFHVDYWDDLGWKDPFASPSFTERQRRYVQAGVLREPSGDRGISGAYTPQMIVAGAVHFSGARRDVALAEISRASAALKTTSPPNLQAVATRIEGDRLTVTARLSVQQQALPLTTAPSGPGRNSLTLIVALAQKSARTSVTRGENGGETLDEVAVVRVLADPTPITTAPGAPVTVTLTKPHGLDWNGIEATAFVQSATTLRVIAARSIEIARR